MQTHLLVLGRQPELSAAEACATLTSTPTFLREDVLAIDNVANPLQWFASLGGSTKLATPLLTIPDWNALLLPTTLQALHAVLAKRTGKISFGFSVYGTPRNAALLTAQKKLKALIVADRKNARFVQSRGAPALSTVVVGKQLLGKGAEFLLIETDAGIQIATTIAVQDFEDFSHRDYDRPGRNAQSGMLPPKLARMMINLAHLKKGQTLFDPFCGSGTVLQEAFVLGAGTLIGRDTNLRAVGETKKNLAWIAQQTQRTLPPMDVRDGNAQTIRLERGVKVDAIVTEPFLGPPQTGQEWTKHLEDVYRELSGLYRSAFRQFRAVLKPDAYVAFLFPVFGKGKDQLTFHHVQDILDSGFRLVPLLPPRLQASYAARLSPRQSIIYRRPGQHVGRELMVFQKDA